MNTALSSHGSNSKQRAQQQFEQFVGSAALGLIVWFIVGLMYRYAPPVVFERGIWTVALFIAAIPNAFFTVWLGAKFVGIKPGHMLQGMAIASAAAMLCDGISLTWTNFYGPENKDVVAVAASLLWGVSMILFAAYVVDRRTYV